ncbi:hypothetical protein ACJ41O_007972 [Fusarium nematophilum]
MHHVSCLCGSVSQHVSPRTTSDSKATQVSICHCDTCRHTTGLLCTSYLPIQEPRISDRLGVFEDSQDSSRYFCSTCGCHLFHSVRDDDAGELSWGVATGVVERSDEESGDVKFIRHTHVADTKDGGAAIWMPLDEKEALLEKSHDEIVDPIASTCLEASCACSRVRLRITRPNEASRQPHRGLPDLTHAYCSTDESVLANPSGQKWWIRGTKYLAGTCACRSCRLVSGFEIQTWAFVPRANIFIQASGGENSGIPLDFDALPAGVLQSYNSSPGAMRHFCGTCGATVFWREKDDAGVIDVSVGLLRAEEGARANSWLEWWTERVSFSEEVQVGRSGPLAMAAQSLIDTLESGLRAET